MKKHTFIPSYSTIGRTGFKRVLAGSPPPQSSDGLESLKPFGSLLRHCGAKTHLYRLTEQINKIILTLW